MGFRWPRGSAEARRFGQMGGLAKRVNDEELANEQLAAARLAFDERYPNGSAARKLFYLRLHEARRKALARRALTQENVGSDPDVS